MINLLCEKERGLQMGRKSKSLPLFITAALIWFGYHCGAGFASGRQVWLYAAQYGTIGIAAPLIIWVLNASFMYISAEYARLKNATNYRDMVSIYYDHPTVNKIALFLWDILIFMAAITVSASCTAGTGSLLQDVFGFPYFVGCAVFIVGMALLLSLGKGNLERLGKFGVPLIIIFFIICLTAIGANINHLADTVTTAVPVTEITFSAFLKRCFIYAITQCSFFQALSILAGKFESRKQSIAFTITGFLMNGCAMLACYLALMAYYPEIGQSNIPIYGIVSQFKGVMGITLTIAYNFVLMLAYITTAGSALVGAQARYTPVLIKWIKSDSACRALVTVLFLAGASLLSTLGLDGILNTVNTINSTCRFPIWFLPFFICGPISIYKLTKKEDQ